MLRAKNKRNGFGFSLIEIMFVLAVVSMLFAIAMPSIYRMRRLARINQTKANLEAVRRAIATECLIEGDYPPWADVRESNVGATLKGAHDCKILRGGNMPDNSFSTSDKWGGVDKDIVYNVGMAKGSLVWGGGIGWCYNAQTGEFWANTDTPGIDENEF